MAFDRMIYASSRLLKLMPVSEVCRGISIRFEIGGLDALHWNIKAVGLYGDNVAGLGDALKQTDSAS